MRLPRIVKRSNVPVRCDVSEEVSVISVLTASICAIGGGEDFSSVTKCSRSSGSPSSMPSSPAEVLRTQPQIWCRAARR